jgi:hypothetical protein
VILAGVLAREDRLLRTPLRAAEVVDGGAVDGRVQPAADLTDRAPVEPRGDRSDERVVRQVLDHVRRHPQRQATLDVALVAADQDHQPRAGVSEPARVPRVADVGDQLVVVELPEVIVGDWLECQGAVWERSSRGTRTKADAT